MRYKNQNLMEQMLNYINTVFQHTGKTPSYREIGDKFGITSACVSNYMKEMKERGMLRNSGAARGVATPRMQKSEKSRNPIPLLGTVACGTPILAEQNVESYLFFPEEVIGTGDFFALYAKGESMINAGINNGDIVVVRQQETAEEGQIVVALIDDEATLKIFHKDKKHKKIVLKPANDNYSELVFDDIKVQGVAVKVIKNISC